MTDTVIDITVEVLNLDLEVTEQRPIELISTPINVKGEEGLSAYEVALNNGFVGTEFEWLESIKGEPYGNIDGGKANSNYGGISMIFGGNAEVF